MYLLAGWLDDWLDGRQISELRVIISDELGRPLQPIGAQGGAPFLPSRIMGRQQVWGPLEASTGRTGLKIAPDLQTCNK